MNRRYREFAVVVVLACATIARAESPTYFSPSAVDPVKLLPEPAPVGSAEDRGELELMLLLQQNRTEKEVQRCASEVDFGVDAYRGVMGPWFTSKNLPQMAKLFHALQKDTRQFTDVAKDHFHRPRPKFEDARIHVPIADEITFAYPSGHATRGMLFAQILAEIAPEHRKALIERGEEIGWDRVIAGLHHPSDICAGRVLGQELAESLLADPKFQAVLVDIKKEMHDAERNAAAPTATVGSR
jgi:acid phosphatase (class A)